MARKAKRDLTMEEQLARGPMDLPFLMLTLMLLGIGLIMVFSASFASAYYDAQTARNNPMYYIQRQAFFAAFGVVIMYIVSKINYQTFRFLSIPLLLVTVLMLVMHRKVLLRLVLKRQILPVSILVLNNTGYVRVLVKTYMLKMRTAIM